MVPKKANKPKVAVFVGTRPEIIKMCSTIRALEASRAFDFVFVHTGQHYDWAVSKSFLEEFSLPNPDFFLNVRSGTHGQQTARIIERSERVLTRAKPSLVLVEGDTNSALGVAIAASKLKVPVGHVEAGCRSFDTAMPEELNRKMIADCSSLNFAPTTRCARNLRREGIPPKAIFSTGHPLVDLFRTIRRRVDQSRVLETLNIEPTGYTLVTVHRQENTDDRHRLESILRAISSLTIPVIFPIHPRTNRKIVDYRQSRFLKNVTVTPPLRYADTLQLIRNAAVVLTDSGGIQQEAYLFRTPCVTLRTTTEWIETVYSGMNFLAGPSSREIIRLATAAAQNRDAIRKRRHPSYFGKGDATSRILRIIMSFCLNAAERR